MRKELPMFIGVLAGLAVIFDRYFVLGRNLGLTATLDDWSVVMDGMMFAVGFINLTRLHYLNVKRRRAGFIYSIVLLVTMYGYLALALYETVDGKNATFIFDNVFRTMGSTMYGMIAFFISSAAYRAFRVRTREATLMLVAAVLVMIGKAPVGDALVAGWDPLAEWILNVINTGGMKGILLGAYLGAFATALRVLLGLERAHLGGAAK